MCKNDILFANRVQNYTFFRTQPNKMHKNRQNVHTLPVLCNDQVVKSTLFLLIFLFMTANTPHFTFYIFYTLLTSQPTNALPLVTDYFLFRIRSNPCYLIRLPKMSRVSSLVTVRVAALVAFLATRPVVEVFDLVFLPVTLSLT